MIKEKLMEALKVAAADYNGGTGANAAVAKAAEAADFNEHQTERLVEMFNTLAAINKEKDASDPTGSCELASKNDVIKMLLQGEGSMSKAASASDSSPSNDDPFRYSFYSGVPEKTNRSIEARNSGLSTMCKAASAEEPLAKELDISQRSLYKVISEKIDFLKSASAAADDVARTMRMEIDSSAIKIAKAIEDPFANPELADMFKAACSKKSAEIVGEYSTKVADSNGGKFASLAVFDSSSVDDLLKVASEMDDYLVKIPEYEKKRDFYMSKASEYEDAMKEILGFGHSKKASTVSIADFYSPDSVLKKAGDKGSDNQPEESGKSKSRESDASLSVKIAELIRKSGVSSDEVARLACDLEKDAAGSNLMAMLSVSPGDAVDALKAQDGLSGETRLLQNIERGLILDDLMANDPILRDADPNTVAEVYKSIIKSSPRISLDKALVRSVLRSAVNSVAVSPADAKILTDVDKGIALSNVERLTNLDSSVKDSNRV